MRSMDRFFSKKEIVLGVTGSIAAYKACDLASRLTQAGARVQAVLTQSALHLVGAATFEGVTGRRAITQMFEPLQNPDVEHIAVAQRADLFIVAPASANTIAKAAHGLADDWLSTTLLATRAPILFAPAMNTNMYTHPATIENMARLSARGCLFVGPDAGRLACGTVGQGRMTDPQTIMEAAISLISGKHELEGRHIVITSGGTHEPIDPVRYIGNRSSGKMGRALALEAISRGAQVTVITGAHEAGLPHNVEVVEVQTAKDMAEAVIHLAQEADAFIGAAAVGDFRVDKPMDMKHKRAGEGITLNLVENPDILSLVSAVKQKQLLTVGFAAETEKLIENAKIKLKKKQLDFIVANEVGTPQSGFGADTVKAAIIDKKENVDELPLMGKDALAEIIFDRLCALLGAGK
ncbi:MAG: phosphopantothenoylcysteine decarboxylase [Candidatus Hydrogenedentota bacterium]